MFTPHILFFERIVAGFTKHPYLFWLLVSLVPINLSVVLFAQTGNRVFISTAMPSSFAISLLPLAIKIGAIFMDYWGRGLRHFVLCPEQEIESWFQNQMAFLSGSLGMLFSGIFLSVLGITLYYFSGVFVGLNNTQAVTLALIILLNCLVSGAAWFSLFCFARIIWRLGRFPLKVEQNPEGVLSTGNTLMKCYAITIILNYTFSLINSIAMQNMRLLFILEAPYIVFFAISFIVCQIPVHNRMVDYKKLKLAEIDGLLASLSQQQNPNTLMEAEALRPQMEALKKTRANIMALPEWPAGWKSVLKIARF
ncbi:membrane hypothetical protein [Crenothrix polyspora]|uniref:Uncharacterized protein n=1 Tax=Crenothrix polyspora TaxID=360316 RepID=A0A1R4HAF8_9GAMM|nr:hypothetical protein [Crenothrix polyspora]SJM93203.1 membrane hypothetical protein [Crenothrix polyspora]